MRNVDRIIFIGSTASWLEKKTPLYLRPRSWRFKSKIIVRRPPCTTFFDVRRRAKVVTVFENSKDQSKFGNGKSSFCWVVAERRQKLLSCSEKICIKNKCLPREEHETIRIIYEAFFPYFTLRTLTLLPYWCLQKALDEGNLDRPTVKYDYNYYLGLYRSLEVIYNSIHKYEKLYRIRLVNRKLPIEL